MIVLRSRIARNPYSVLVKPIDDDRSRDSLESDGIADV